MALRVPEKLCITTSEASARKQHEHYAHMITSNARRHPVLSYTYCKYKRSLSPQHCTNTDTAITTASGSVSVGPTLCTMVTSDNAINLNAYKLYET